MKHAYFYIILCDIHVYFFQQSYIKIEPYITKLNRYVYVTKFLNILE